MITTSDILNLLSERNISYRMALHKRVFSIAEMDEVEIDGKEYIAKNIVLRDDKRSAFFLLSVPHDRKVDLKALRRALSSRPLSFLEETSLQNFLSISQGEVTPFALLNDEARRFTYIMDESFLPSVIGIHPNDNSKTVFLSSSALIALLKDLSVHVSVIDIPKLGEK